MAHGQVILDLEIQEAQAFLDGAQASFADLRLPLRAIDPDETAAVESILMQLDAALNSAADRGAVADPATVKAEAADAAQRLDALFPTSWLEASGDSGFDIVASLLDQMVAAAAAGEYQQAESSRIEAYAIFETGPEKRLLAFTPDAAQKVERLFWEGDGQTPGLYRLLTSHAQVSQVNASRQAFAGELASAQAALKAGTAPAAIVFNAATIVFREGLEAILILASLLASMIGANRQVKKPLALGALTLVLQTKLPHKKMLIVTGVMIAVVLVTMVGSTAHTLQLIGWLPISPIPGTESLPYWTGVWLGIHGTWQGLVAQLVAVAFVFGSYFLAEHQHRRVRSSAAAATSNPGSIHERAVPASEMQHALTPPSLHTQRASAGRGLG